MDLSRGVSWIFFLIYLKGSQSQNLPPKVSNSFYWQQGVVPYYIDLQSYDNIIVKRIRHAMHTIESASCVVFTQLLEPPSGEAPKFYWLALQNPDKERECIHEAVVGERRRVTMVLGYDCMQLHDIIHALLHVLGFKDEVTHPQRDLYIRVMWQNIQPKYHHVFQIKPISTLIKLVEYDTMSVMHFHDRAFSVNGGATIAPLIPGLLISPSEKLSQLDIMKLRLSFGHECNKRKVGNLHETCQNALDSKSDMYSDSSSYSSRSISSEEIHDVHPPTEETDEA